MHLKLFGKGIFITNKMRCVLLILLSAVLGFAILFASGPIFSSSSEKDQYVLNTFSYDKYLSQLGRASPSLQSKYNLLAPASQSQLFIQTVSDTRPYASLSLSGPLGDNGWYTSDVEASFYITGGDSESATVEYTFYNQPWKTYSEPFMIFEEGQTPIYYRVRDSTGFLWETTVTKVDIDKTPPKGSTLIDEGANDALSTLVTLALSVIDEPSGPTTPPPSGYIWGVPSGPSRMRFSNNGILWSEWESIASTKSWTLETGPGTKTVYVQARDNAGLVSEPFSDTINLVTTGDSIAPKTEILVNGKKDSSGVYTSAVAITLSATDDLAGVALIEYSYDSHNWTEYTGALPLYAEGETTIYFRSHDANGNIESVNSQTIEIRKTEETNSFLPLAAGIVALVVAITLVVVLSKRGRKRQNQIDELTET